MAKHERREEPRREEPRHEEPRGRAPHERREEPRREEPRHEEPRGRAPHEHPDHPEHHLHKDVQHGHVNRDERGAHHDGRERMGRGAYHEGAKGAPHETSRNRGMGEREPTGRDAAGMRPRLIPDFELLGRDDSGGPEWQPYTAEFGDGGYVTGPKAHLSVNGGRDDELRGDEQNSTVDERNSGRGGRVGSDRDEGIPMSSRRRARD